MNILEQQHIMRYIECIKKITNMIMNMYKIINKTTNIDMKLNHENEYEP